MVCSQVLSQELMESRSGILPIANSILEYSELFAEWRLPGHGESYHDCGDWLAEGCLHSESHVQNELFSDVEGQAFVKWHKRSCNRPDCPICYEKWCAKEASKIEHILKYTWSAGKIIHVAISPSDHDLRFLPYPELRKKTYQIAYSRGVKGGVCIFHHVREAETGSGIWEYRPHFHILGYGWIRNTAELYRKDGWIVKNILDGAHERSTFRTAQYQLSHCGLSDHARSITWFGVCSTAKKYVVQKGLNGEMEKFSVSRAPPLPKEKLELCPDCGKPLVRLKYNGNMQSFVESIGEKEAKLGVWVNPSGWSEDNRYKAKWR